MSAINRKYWKWVPVSFRRRLWDSSPRWLTDRLRPALGLPHLSPASPPAEVLSLGESVWFKRSLSDSIRDTDADWQKIASENPFWGVLTHERFKNSNLGPNEIKEFMESGANHIAGIVATLKGLGAGFPVGHALDFGCGVGRLAIPMRRYAGSVTGIDISDDMLAISAQQAESAGVGNISFARSFENGPRIDWLNSAIVFQHIDPRRGMELFHSLLDRLSPQASLSLHFTICRTEDHGASDPPVGTMEVYDYDLTEITATLFAHNFTNLLMQPTWHGPHVGAFIYGFRSGN